MAKMSRALAKARHGLSRARHHARGVLGGRMKPTVYAGGAGAAAQVVGEMARGSVEMLRTHWYAEPGVILAAGIVSMRKNATIGAGLCGAGGYLLAQNYKLNQFQQGKRSTSPIPTFSAATSSPGVAEMDSGFLQA